MRFLLLGLALALAAPATAAAAFAPPVSIPSTTAETPRALAFGADGRGIVVTQDGGQPYGKPTQALATVPGARRTAFADTELLDSVRRGDGGVDLLVRHGSDPTRRGDLILRRVRPSGQTRPVVGAHVGVGRRAHPFGHAHDRRLAAGDAAAARQPPGRRHPLQAQVVPAEPALDHRRRPRGRCPQAAHRGDDDLARSRAGVAVVARHRFQRQERRASGLVEVAVTSGGRVGVRVEDTGIEGDGGECVADRGGRHIRVAVRERGAVRFGATQTIESPRFGCGSGGALLRALPGNALAVLYQGGSYDFPPLLARAATAADGAPFGAPSTLATDARADSAVVASGQLVTALLRKTVQPELFTGAVSVLRGGGPEEAISLGPRPRRCWRPLRTATPCSRGARPARCSSPPTSRRPGCEAPARAGTATGGGSGPQTRL